MGRIHPVDKSLLIFMAVLLLQSAVGMFLPGGAGQITGSIDVVVRTSAAAIFGYFLSANFIRSASEPQSPSQAAAHRLETGSGAAGAPGPTARIGFAAGEDSPQQDGGAEILPAGGSAGCLQITIAAAIGLFCLAALLALRNLTQMGLISPEDSAVTATVTQFRDFVSGCVGFLIGSPTHSTQSAS